jgi:hypothetical protein
MKVGLVYSCGLMLALMNGTFVLAAEAKIDALSRDRDLTLAEEAVVKEDLDAGWHAAKDAVESAGNSMSTDTIDLAKSAINKYCGAILSAASLHIPVANKIDHASHAIDLAQTIKYSPLEKDPLFCVKELHELLLAPATVLAERLNQAKKLFREMEYERADRLISSFIDIPEVGVQRGALLFHGLCLSRMHKYKEAVAPLGRVIALGGDDAIWQKAVVVLGAVEIATGKVEEAKQRLHDLIARCAPSEQCQEAVSILRSQ